MANWPGTVVQPQEAYGNRRILTQGPLAAPTQAQQAPQGSVAGEYPGEAVDGLAVREGNLAGDIGFYNDSAMDANSRPVGSDEFQRAAWEGIQNGSIRNMRDFEELQAKFGFTFSPENRALAAQIFENAAKGIPISGVNPAEFATRPIAELRQNAILPEKLDAAARGGAGWIGLDDEIDALTTTALHGGKLRENLANSRAIRDYDEENNFWPRLGGEVVGSTLTGFGLPSRLREVGSVAARQVIRMGGTREAALTAARRAIAIRSAQEGAAMGGTSGFFEADGNLLDRTAGGFGGALAGGTAGAAFGGVGSRLAQRGMRRVEGAGSPSEELMGAYDRLEIDPFSPDVGGATTRRIAAATVQTPFGAAPIVKAAQRVTDQAQGVRDRVAGRIGNALNPEAAGEAGIQGARDFIARTSTQGNLLYRAAEQAAADTRIKPTQALAKLDEHIAELAETPTGSTGLAQLEALRDALSKGDFTVRGIRNMRTALRDEFESAGLRGSDIERRAKQVVDAANEDVISGLRAAGRDEAAERFAKADAFWKKRLETIDSVIEPIIGKDGGKSGEEVVAGLQRAMKGNNRRFVEYLDALPEAERNDIRATLISRLGRSTKTGQNDEGTAFSLQTFLSNWDEIGESAKRALFGPESRAAMNDLAKVANASREAQVYANKSQTGGAMGGLFTGLTALPTMFGVILGQNLSGRLIASPRFARWLARAPRTQLSTPAYIDRLGRIARAEPAIAGDVLSLQRQLMDAFSGAPSKLAAEEDKQEPSGIVGQNNESAEQRRQPELTP